MPTTEKTVFPTLPTLWPKENAHKAHFALKPVRKLNAVDATSVSAEDTADGTETALVSQRATVSSEGTIAGKKIHFLGMDDENADLETARTLYLTLLIVSIILFVSNLAAIVICCLYRSAVKGLAGMTDTKLRRLTRLSALLAVPAVILFAAVCFTGGMLCFINHSLAEAPDECAIAITTEPEEALPSEGEDSSRDLDVGKVGGDTGKAIPPADNTPVCKHVFALKATDKYLVSAANCSSPAVYHESCSRCGATGTATFSAGERNPNKHTSLTYGMWLINASEHWRTCTCAGCGYEKTERGSHTWVDDGKTPCICGATNPGPRPTAPTEATTASTEATTAPTEAMTAPTETTAVPTTEKTVFPTLPTLWPKENAHKAHFALKPVRKLNAVDATSVSAEDTADGTETALVSQGATVSSDGSAAGKLIHLLGLDDENADLEAGRTLYLTLFLICIVFLAADVAGIVILSGRIRRGRRIESISAVPKTQSLKRGTTGFDFAKVHGQGARRYQQDSHGMTPVMNGEGVFAIVADGMGGLSGGEQVSQQIVMQALNHMADITSAQVKIALPEMLSRVNGAVNKMLGPDGLYKSGSTLVAVLVVRDRLRWISVGDSRIYLYRDGWMNQLTQDHDLLQEWMPDILSGKRSYAEALADPEGKKLTSFIGMGELKYIDSCTSPIRILPGDRIVLMSDGVYNSVPAETMADILRKNPDVQRAAGMLHKAVRAAANPHQDNYTAEILAF